MTEFPFTILQVVPALNAGGAERTTADIARAIVLAGGRALVATSGGFLTDEIIENGGEIVSGSFNSKNPVAIRANAQRLTQLIIREKIDVVHARSRAPAWSALWAAKKTGAAYVATHHRTYSPSNPIKRLYNSSILRADLVIANSQFTADSIAAGGAVEAKRLRVIPRGVDVEKFDPNSVSQNRINQLARNWGVKTNTGAHHEPGAMGVLLPARLTRWKGHGVAIKALASIKSQKHAGNMPKLTLVFCGGAQDGGSYETSLRVLVDECGVREMVHFVGECADMPAAYGWADVVLSPSIKPESFGRAPIEAGAMSKPVIASDHGGAKETIDDGKTGVLVPPGDVDALASAFAAMAVRPDAERAEMGAKARKRIVENFSVDAMAVATLDVYREAVAKGNC